jgi:hypothetical protein
VAACTTFRPAGLDRFFLCSWQASAIFFAGISATRDRYQGGPPSTAPWGHEGRSGNEMRSTFELPAEHYAAGWSVEGPLRSHTEINQLGRLYAERHDQDALLELCQCFHPYLMKYLVMICRADICRWWASVPTRLSEPADHYAGNPSLPPGRRLIS